MENGWREGAQSCGLGADLSGAAGTADVAGMGLGGAAGAGLGGGLRLRFGERIDWHWWGGY